MQPDDPKTTHEAVMADTQAADRLTGWKNRMIVGMQDYRDHGGTVEDAMGILLRVFAGEKLLPEIVDVKAHTRRTVSKHELEQKEAKFAHLKKKLFGLKLMGRDIGEIGTHEWAAIEREGGFIAAVARRMKEKMPVLPDGQSAVTFDVISKEEVDKVWAEAKQEVEQADKSAA